MWMFVAGVLQSNLLHIKVKKIKGSKMFEEAIIGDGLFNCTN
jgi:hypothetical protein